MSGWRKCILGKGTEVWMVGCVQCDWSAGQRVDSGLEWQAGAES